jgi:hypothetical protein
VFCGIAAGSQRRRQVTINEFNQTRPTVSREQLHQECLARCGKMLPIEPAEAREAATVAWTGTPHHWPF